MRKKFEGLRRTANWLGNLERQADSLDLPTRSSPKHTKVLVGTMLAQLNLQRTPRELREVEFQVFSQFGDDGIVQYLVHSLGITDRTFIEFGVEDYTEANTRFLLVKDKWSGVVFDGSQRHVDYINRDLVSLFYDVRPRQAFITAENINALLADTGLGFRIGLLSIDIDGVDYWVWRAIEGIEPAIVVIEYNATFGPERPITVPYQPDFVRSIAHPSRLYWGASLAALQDLGQEKGYAFIGCNANGNNAYFVRNDYASSAAIADLERPFHAASFAEHQIEGVRTRGTQVLDAIRGLPVHNVRTGETERL
jgi:hypothetical protein